MDYFLVDFENVKSDGMKDLKGVKKGDSIIVFYSENCKTISIDVIVAMTMRKIQFSWQKVTVGTKNALDFQLASHLGYLIGLGEENERYHIVSDDKGYDCLCEYWKKMNKTVDRVSWSNHKKPQAETNLPAVITNAASKAAAEAPPAQTPATAAPLAAAQTPAQKPEKPEPKSGEPSEPVEAEPAETKASEPEIRQASEAANETENETAIEQSAEEIKKADTNEPEAADTIAEEKAIFSNLANTVAKIADTAVEMPKLLGISANLEEAVLNSNQAPKPAKSDKTKKGKVKASDLITLTELRKVLSDEDSPEQVLLIFNQYKTKQAINNGIVKQFKDGKRAGAVYQKLKPLLKEKNKS